MNDRASDTATALSASTSAVALATTTTMPEASAPAEARPKRGRKPETPAQRLLRLEHQLAEAKVAAKEAERRMFAVVGEALLAEAAEDAALKACIVDTLRRRVTTASAKADIASLLAG